MKRFSFVALILVTAFSAMGQIKEANPNIDTEWRFVRSQELNMASGRFYTYEFPADKKFDYIFNLTHNKNKVYASIAIFDLQDQPIQKVVLDESNLSVDLHFDLPESGTYKVVLGVTDPKGKKDDAIPAQFSLIRRVKF